MRGIPVPFDQIPKTATNLGRVQPARGPQSRGDAGGFVRAASDAALINARGFVVAEQSVGQIGQAVEQEGHAMAALRIKANEAIGIRHEREAEDAMEAAKMAISTDIAREPDETKWLGLADKQIKTVSDKVLAGNYSPDTRERISLNLQSWQARMRGVTDQHAAETSINRGVQIKRQQVEAARLQQDPERFEASLSELRKFGGITDAGIELERIQYGETGKQLQNVAKAERYNVAQNLAVARASNFGEASAVSDLEAGRFGDVSSSDKERLRGTIQQVARDRSAAVMDSVSERILSGEINSEALIDNEEGPFFGPKLQRQAKQFLKSFNSFEQQRDREQNGIRNAVALRVRVQEYDPSQDEDRTEYFTLSSAIRASVDEENAGDILRDLAKKYGVEPPDVKVRPEIKQGITRSISALYDPEFGAIQWRKEFIDEKTGAKYTRVDQVKRQEAIDAAARLEIQMHDWFQMNPDKAGDFKAARQHRDSIIPSGTRASALTPLQTLLPGKSPLGEAFDTVRGAIGSLWDSPSKDGARGQSGPQGVEFTAPPAGTRVTSYAYDNDETPDSNSAAGIGAFVPRAEQAKIKRGEESSYRLREGDFAVSRDVERSLVASGIRPGDTVEVRMADGSTVTGRWMDRTADNLKGRWDFYQGGKKHKHANEGGKVTGFRRP